MYVGKRDSEETGAEAYDHQTGAAAVIRNLAIVLKRGAGGHRLVVIDRFYSSVALAIQLLSMGVYVIGTIMTNRIGFDPRVVEKRKTRPRGIDRGQFTYSRSVAVPTMIACHWWDRKPVHYLATGPSMVEQSIHRNVKGVGSMTVPCPKLVTDYQRWMGGVDVHDQLRLQSYSIQRSFRFRKYYKSLFLGFLDMVLVNAFITHKEVRRAKGEAAMNRGDWMGLLQNQLLRLKDSDFDVAVTPSPAVRSRKRRRANNHTTLQVDDWITISGAQKRRQRSCKVCGLLRGERKKSFQTTHYCVVCSVDDAKCFLCNKTRRDYKGVAKTCVQIWHEDFESGLAIPASLGKRVVMRRPRKTGQRKKTRRELLRDGDDEDDDADDEEEEAVV